jgi:hypothetical protein
MPEALPVGAWQFCCPPEVPLFEVDDESPEPQAARARGESARRATAGRRRTRFMRDSSREDEEVLRSGTLATAPEPSLSPACPPPVREAKHA